MNVGLSVYVSVCVWGKRVCVWDGVYVTVCVWVCECAYEYVYERVCERVCCEGVCESVNVCVNGCMVLCVCTGAVHTCGGQGTSSSAAPHLPPWDRSHLFGTLQFALPSSSETLQSPLSSHHSNAVITEVLHWVSVYTGMEIWTQILTFSQWTFTHWATSSIPREFLFKYLFGVGEMDQWERLLMPSLKSWVQSLLFMVEAENRLSNKLCHDVHPH